MSDPVAEPGVPTQPQVENNPPSKDVATLRDSMPRSLTSITSDTDKLLLRLNKLFSSPGGLSSFLSTFNYTLYLLTYLQTKAPPLSSLPQLLLKLVNYNRNITTTSTVKPTEPPVGGPPAGPTGIAALATHLSGTRTTLRLFGLFPLYVWLRTLSKGPKPDQDRSLYAITLAQCLSYVAFQSLENIALLIDKDVLPKSTLNRFNKGQVIATTRIYKWSYRAWLVGVLCDFPRLIREAQLESNKRAARTSGEKASSEEEDRTVDAKWYSELLVPCAWLPVAIQFGTERGFPGMNLGIMGACGALAGLGRTSAMWAATKDV